MRWDDFYTRTLRVSNEFQPARKIVFRRRPGNVRPQARLAEPESDSYITDVNYLTKQEQMFLIVVLGLLLTGWAVKTYRTAHPPSVVAVQPVKP
jgi:hypothetical protein